MSRYAAKSYAFLFSVANPELADKRMRSKPPTLTPDIRQLCGRLANELTKRTAWMLAAQVRSEMLVRLQAGELVQALTDDLNAQIQQAAPPTRRA